MAATITRGERVEIAIHAADGVAVVREDSGTVIAVDPATSTARVADDDTWTTDVCAFTDLRPQERMQVL